MQVGDLVKSTMNGGILGIITKRAGDARLEDGWRPEQFYVVWLEEWHHPRWMQPAYLEKVV